MIDSTPDLTAVTYDSLEVAEATVKATANQNGYVVNRLRSKTSKTRVICKVWLCCAHGRECTNSRPYLTEETRQRQTSTHRMNCPWSAILQRNPTSGTWTIEIKHNSHNHERSSNIAAYPSARTLAPDDISTIERISRAGAAPKVLLSTLRQANPNILMIAQDIYNVKKTLRMRNLCGCTPLEALLDELEAKGVMHDYKKDMQGHITHLFFAPTTSITLAREFRGVLLMDSTYKTNRYIKHIIFFISIFLFLIFLTGSKCLYFMSSV